MSNLFPLSLSLVAYVFCARASLSISNRRIAMGLFAATNIAGVAWLSLLTRYSEWERDTILSLGFDAVARHLVLIALYVAAIAVAFYLTRHLAYRKGALPWIAFFYPITLLVIYRYFDFGWKPVVDALGWPDWVITATIIGLSYMAFRLSYLVLEVRNGSVEMPSLGSYLGFAFFIPTLVIGPISTYATHSESIGSMGDRPVELGRSLLRIVVGLTKFLFLANLANQLSYSGIFLDGKPHGLFDLGVAMVFYYLYLYLNFSGFCDMGIGVAGLIGIKVKENFNNPFIAKNVKEFWNRWHITLSEYTRDVIFAPVSKSLIKKLGPRYSNLSISVGILCVFLTIGIWHGVGIMFILFGLVHAVGVVANHYYTIRMKRALGPERYKAYNENSIVNAVATVLTFLYVAASFSLFANSYSSLGIIWRAISGG